VTKQEIEILQNFVNEAIMVPFKSKGRDWQGWDCWGMITHLFKRFDIVIPVESKDYCEMTGEEAMAEIENHSRFLSEWREVFKGDEKPGDVILIRADPLHVGVVLDNGLMLHTGRDTGTVVSRYLQSLWSKRIIGFYRHAKY
jgi:cell wall-associated NlpC family hydrolase